MSGAVSSAGGRFSLAGKFAPRLAGAVVVAALALGSCAGAPNVPLGSDGRPDAVLEQGREVYGRQCAACHGRQGQGGTGQKLNDGRAEAQYPDIADMIAVVDVGKGSGMPAFGKKLDPSEIDAVSRYIREVLG